MGVITEYAGIVPGGEPIRISEARTGVTWTNVLKEEASTFVKEAVAFGTIALIFPLKVIDESKTVEGNRSPKLGGGYTCPLMVDTFIDEMEPPFEVIEEVLIVDVLTVTKFAVANALLVFISPCRLMLLALKVLSDVRRPEAWTTAPTTVPVADTLAAVMFPVAVIVEARKIGGVGAGKTLPLMDEMVRAGVEIQLLPVMKLPLI